MPNKTTNLGYDLPLGNETADIDVLNNNFTKIDTDITAKLVEAKGYTDDRIKELVRGAPEALDTLKELANALGDDANFSSTVVKELASKVDKEEFSSQLADKTNKSDYVANNAFATTSGTSTAYTATLSPAPTAYVDGMNITIKPHVDCGATPTLNVNGLGALTIVKQDGTAIAAGDLKAGKPYSLVRVGSNFFIRSGGGKYDVGKSIYLENLQLLYKGGDEIWSNSDVPYAEDIAVDSSGNVYVTYVNSSSKAVRKLNPSGSEIWSNSDVSKAYGIAVDSSGYVYVAYENSIGSKSVRKLDSSGNEVWSKLDVGNAVDIAVDSSGNVYVAYMNSIGKTVRKLDSNGSEIWSNSDVPYAEDIAVDSSGNVYVTYVNSSSKAVRKLNPSGNEVWSKSDMSDAQSIVVDNNNNVYAAGYGSGRYFIEKLNSSGYVIFTMPFTSLVRIAVDNSGYIYVAYYQDSGNAVEKYDSNALNRIWSNSDVLYAHNIAVDSNGNVYVAYGNSSGKTVRKLHAYTEYKILN
ncbi:NHL repeat-containing protein [Clostridium oryzae]|uniref:Serine/threonine-protein kinase PknD n=1 Tax=Clostridium oryzae TaxID=1450648 RepID=A0A1V4IFX3_9CLOT|nr:NHL repeat-containing protein [Clostridium oryzae]OPJ58427.1 serine/threonine-protein kinase PknD [Clostridium oryzae]